MDVKGQKIEVMREGGRILARILQEVKERTKPGVNELEISKWVEKRVLADGAVIAYYEPEVKFPAAICIAVNDELIHGVPEDNILMAGDKVSYDLTIGYKGYYLDSAFSMIVGGDGAGTAMLRRLLSVTETALYEGIAQIRAGERLGTMGSAVEKVLEGGGLGVIRDYIGHGIGKKMHLPPEVPNYGRKGTGYKLQVGDALCIEPMASLGKVATVVGDDGWTVLIKDGSMGAHFEHTVLVTERGCEILTTWE